MKVFYVISCILILAMAYLLITPILVALPGVIKLPFNLSTAEQIKNYYSVVSAFFTIILGTSGLFLGFFYFQNRKKFDNETKKRESIRNRIDVLLNSLDKYDSLIHSILCKCVSDQSELSRTRHEIERIWEIIEGMLEYNNDKCEMFGFDKDEIKKIVKVNSFVDKSDLIMRNKYEIVKKTDTCLTKNSYRELIRYARHCCYQKMLMHTVPTQA